MAVPPELTVYQRYCPLAPPEAMSTIDPLPHRLLLVVVGAEGIAFTVNVAVFVVTGAATSPVTSQR